MGPSYTDLLLYAGEGITALGILILIVMGIRRLIDWWDTANGNEAPDHEGVTEATTMLIMPTTARQVRLANLDDSTRFFVPQEWIDRHRAAADRRGRHSVEYIAEITGTLALSAA